MHLKINSLVLASTVAATSFVAPAYAQHRSVDATTLAVADVKTGMDMEQAIKALTAHFKVPRSKIMVDPNPKENLVTHTTLPLYVKYEHAGEAVTVYFEGRVPLDKARPLAVSMVSYELPRSAQNAQAMAAATLEKYGQQSNFPNNSQMQWCAAPSSNPGVECPSDQAYLQLADVNLKLVDPAWSNARIKFVQDSQARKPGF